MTRTRMLWSLPLLLLTGAFAGAQGVPPDPRDNIGAKLPGNLQNVGLPELAFAASSPRNFAILMNPNNSLPAMDVDVTTTGGAAPVKFSMAGGAAGALYQIVEPPPKTMQRVLSPAEQAAADLEARVNPRPAGVSTRKLRFIGAAQIGGFTAGFPVLVRATDARGETVTMQVTGLPIAPRILPITQLRTARETWSLPIFMEGFGAMTQVRIDGVSNDCGFLLNPRVSVNPVLNIVNGRTSTSRSGSFRTSAAGCASLRVTVAFRLPGATNFGAPLTLAVPPFNFRAPQTYAFGDTKSLRNFFGFNASSQVGSCSGNSTGLNGTHPVGVIENNDDIAFVVRSGPLGTECTFVSAMKRLPDGFVLTKMEFSKLEGPNDSPTHVQMAEPRHYCSIGGSGGTAGGSGFDFSRGTHVLYDSVLFDDNGPPVGEFVVTGFQRPLLTEDNVIALDSTDTNFATVLLPMFLKLRCVITVSNSEFIGITLKRVEFIGPPGLTFP